MAYADTDLSEDLKANLNLPTFGGRLVRSEHIQALDRDDVDRRCHGGSAPRTRLHLVRRIVAGTLALLVWLIRASERTDDAAVLLQPTLAFVAALKDGIKDARSGHKAFF